MLWFTFGLTSFLLQLDNLVGRSVTAVLSNVSDIYGNYIMSPVTWSFAVADFGTTNASAYVVGARLSTSYATFLTKQGEASAIQTQLAAYFGVAANRITSVSAFKTMDALTAFTFIIKPSSTSSDTKTATWLANKFAKDVALLTSSSPFTSFASLAPIIKSTVSSVVVHFN
jgi:hypothetical protein